MSAPTTSAASGWSCAGFGGEFHWSAWNERGNLRGLASSLDECRTRASVASRILNRPEGDV